MKHWVACQNGYGRRVYNSQNPEQRGVIRGCCITRASAGRIGHWIYLECDDGSFAYVRPVDLILEVRDKRDKSFFRNKPRDFYHYEWRPGASVPENAGYHNDEYYKRYFFDS